MMKSPGVKHLTVPAKSTLRISILESQSSEDFTKPLIGKPLSDIMALCEWNCTFQVVVARSALVSNLVGFHQRCSADASLVPVLHLIAPHRLEGFAMTSREVVRWSGLAGVLAMLTASLDGRLHVSVHSASAFDGLAAAFESSGSPAALIGPAQDGTFRESALSLAMYCHRISTNASPEEAAEAVGCALGRPYRVMIGRRPGPPEGPFNAETVTRLLTL